MKSQERQWLKTVNINDNLQYKLSQIISNSPSSYQIQSDSVMLMMRQGQSVDIYFCDAAFTCLENSLAIEGVKSISEIKVKYNSHQKQVIIIYHANNSINFYKGKLPSQENERARSTIVTSQTATIPFGKDQQILSMSEILYMPKIGTHCLIVTKSGKINLLQYQQSKRQLSILDNTTTNIHSKIGGFLKSIFRPTTQPEISYSRCKSILYLGGESQNVYSLTLIDNKLCMKYFSLVNRNSNCENRGWEADLKESLSANTQIINCIFVPKKGYENKHKVTLILLGWVANSCISLFEILIDLNTQIKRVKLVESNLFEGQRGRPILFNKDTDYIEIAEINQRIYVVLNYRADTLFKINSTRSHKIAVLYQTQNKLQIIKQTDLHVLQQLKLAKIQKPPSLLQSSQRETQQSPRLLIICESHCYEVWEFDSSQNYQNSSSHYSANNQNSNYNLLKQRSLPPLPSYDEEDSKNFDIESKGFYQGLNISTDANHQFFNPFSQQKVNKLIQKKDFNKLFKYIELQKAQFNQQTKYILDLSKENSQKFTSHLINLILLKLFTIQKGLECELNMDLINQIFNQEIYNKFYQNKGEKYEEFLRSLFVNKNTQLLQQIFRTLFNLGYYKQLYDVCIDIIPTYLQNIFTKHQSQSMIQQKTQNLNYVRVSTEIKNQITLAYLILYERLMLNTFKLNSQTSSFFKPGAKIEIKAIQKSQFSEYQRKQLFDKYLIVKGLTKTENSQTSKIIQQIFDLYAKQAKYRNFMFSMAIKHENFLLFDYLLRKRMIGREDIDKFVKHFNSNENRQQIKRIFTNFVNIQIQQQSKIMNQRQKNPSNSRVRIDCLLQIPSSYQKFIFQQLILSHPTIGLVYGLKIRNRRQMAANLDKRKQLFELFEDPNLVLDIIGPLYSCTDSPMIKLNIDLAKALILQKKFVPAAQILQNKIQSKIKLPQQEWKKLEHRVKKYLKNQDLGKLRNIFELN